MVQKLVIRTGPTISSVNAVIILSFWYSISIGSLADLSFGIYIVSKKKKKGFHHSQPTYVEDSEKFQGFKVAGFILKIALEVILYIYKLLHVAIDW